jgi:ribosomal protein S18 acetylase RimI-like enzyme
VPRGSDAPRAPAIEAARRDDVAALARIAVESLPEPWSEAGFSAELATPVARVWVARGDAGEPVAYLVAHAVGGELQVLSLAVAAAWRRRGVGRRLLAHALHAEPATRVAHLEVRSDDAGARAFYEEMGFRAIGRRPRFYAGGVDALTMQRALEPVGEDTGFPRG